MNRVEFITQLREALRNYDVPQQVIEKNVRFYEQYIADEKGKGKSEGQILADLGDPRLLARTIADTWQGDDESADYDTSDTYEEYSGSGYGQDSYTNPYEYGGNDPYYSEREREYEKQEKQAEKDFKKAVHHFQMKGWMVTAIILLIIILIFLFFFWILTGILHLTFAIVTSRLFWIIVIVCIVVALVRRHRR